MSKPKKSMPWYSSTPSDKGPSCSFLYPVSPNIIRQAYKCFRGDAFVFAHETKQSAEGRARPAHLRSDEEFGSLGPPESKPHPFHELVWLPTPAPRSGWLLPRELIYCSRRPSRTLTDLLLLFLAFYFDTRKTQTGFTSNSLTTRPSARPINSNF